MVGVGIVHLCAPLIAAVTSLPEIQSDGLYTLFGRFGTAAALGLLVGLEREWAKSGAGPLFAGIRTFPSIALLGAVCAMVTQRFEVHWFFAAGFLGFAGLVAVSHLATSSLPTHGTTTEITSLLVYVLGGLVYFGELAVATAITITVVLLLSLKEPLHALARRIEAQDLYATLKFGVLALVIMPLLPHEGIAIEGLEFLSVLNPWKIWLIVVFVSGIGLLGYVSAKLFGARRGLVLTGVLGGIASSTAVAASMAARSNESGDRLAPQLALATVLASTMMFPRTIIEVLFVSRRLALGLVIPLLAAAIFGLLASAYLWFREKNGEGEETFELKNPFRLAPALKFGFLFACTLVAARIAQEQFATTGLFVIAIVGGFIDTRPIALSVAHLVVSGDVGVGHAVPVVMLAALSNTLLKGGYAAMLGSRAMRREVLPAFTLIIVGGVGALVGVIYYGDLLLELLRLQ